MDDDDWLGLMGSDGEWDSLIRTLGLCGKQDDRIPAALKDKIRLPMNELVEKLRSGDAIPASAMKILAELIDPRFGIFAYQLELVEVRKKKREFERGADSIGIGLEIERIVRDEKVNVSKAIISLGDGLGIDERSMWRHWRKYKIFYPTGYLSEFEKAELEHGRKLKEAMGEALAEARRRETDKN
jgi:hypothetical protein